MKIWLKSIDFWLWQERSRPKLAKLCWDRQRFRSEFLSYSQISYQRRTIVSKCGKIFCGVVEDATKYLSYKMIWITKTWEIKKTNFLMYLHPNSWEKLTVRGCFVLNLSKIITNSFYCHEHVTLDFIFWLNLYVKLWCKSRAFVTENFLILVFLPHSQLQAALDCGSYSRWMIVYLLFLDCLVSLRLRYWSNALGDFCIYAWFLILTRSFLE